MNGAAARSQTLLEARRRDSDAKYAAVLREVRALLEAGEAVSIAVVAKRAGVSRQFIYGNATLIAKVEAARETQRDIGVKGLRTSSNTTVTEAGVRTDLLLAQQEVRRLREANEQLRRQLRTNLGARLDSQDEARVGEQLEARTRDLERAIAERNRLTARNADLERQIRVLTEDLTAERRAHASSVRALTSSDNVVPLR